MKHRRCLAAAGIVLGLTSGLLCPASAAATAMLDQSQTVTQSSSNVSSDATKAQIFTARMYGRLDWVSVYVENWPSPPAGAVLTISVQTVIEGLPSGRQIGSGTIPLSAIPPSGNPGWVDVSIHGAVVTAGTPYALVLQTSPWNAVVDWWFARTNYAGGEMASNDGTTWRIDADLDFTFKTYVTPDVLDQGPPQDQNGEGWLYGPTMGQIFTAGMNGVIDRVAVYLANWLNGTVTAVGTNGPVEASIQTVTGGCPSGNVIGQGSIPAGAIPAVFAGWVTINISNAPVSAGTKYALVLHVGSGNLIWRYVTTDIYGQPQYPGGEMVFKDAHGWHVPLAPESHDPINAQFMTYVLPPLLFAPPPPPATITPCSSGVCPGAGGLITPPDSPARVTSLVNFRELPNGTVHGSLHFDDSRTGGFVLKGCTTDSAACRLTVTTFACTDQHSITVAGTYTPKGEEAAGYYLLTLSGVRGGLGTFTLAAEDYTYTLTRYGIVNVTCPPPQR